MTATKSDANMYMKMVKIYALEKDKTPSHCCSRYFRANTYPRTGTAQVRIKKKTNNMGIFIPKGNNTNLQAQNIPIAVPYRIAYS